MRLGKIVSEIIRRDRVGGIVRVKRLKLVALKPEERVAQAINMSRVVVQVCIDSIRDRNPKASEHEIIVEARRRIMYRRVVHHEV